MLSGLISSIFTAAGGKLIEKFIDSAESLVKDYLNQKITREELRAKLVQAFVSSAADIEKNHAESISKTFDSFMRAATQSILMQVVWASAAISQLIVLLWHQMGLPFYVWFSGHPYPSSGTTVEWAYAVLMFCLGGGAIALRVGPGKVDLKDLAAVK